LVSSPRKEGPERERKGDPDQSGFAANTRGKGANKKYEGQDQDTPGALNADLGRQEANLRWGTYFNTAPSDDEANYEGGPAGAYRQE